MQEAHRCMGTKANGARCTAHYNGRTKPDAPHLKLCGVHWNVYVKRIDRTFNNEHHREGGCFNLHTNTGRLRYRWCPEPIMANSHHCILHQPPRVIEPEVEIAMYEQRIPVMTYREVIDDVFRRPELNRGIRRTIAGRYYANINPNAWQNGYPDPNFDEYFQWRLMGGHGLPPPEVAVGLPRGELRTIAQDRQNVHTRVVSQQTNRGLDTLLEVQRRINVSMRSPEWFASRWLQRGYGPWLAVAPTVTDMMHWYTQRSCRENNDHLYKRTLDGLFMKIKTLPSEDIKAELYKRTFEECFESIGLCCDGHISRLCNVLVGFDDAFTPPVAFGEILQNKMAALFAMDIPTEEKLIQAIAFFNEFAVPEAERTPWLEAF